MIVNDDVGCLNARVARTFFASRLAPTVDRVHLRMIGWLSGRLRCDAAPRQASSYRKARRARALNHSSGRALARLQLLILIYPPLR